MRTRSGPPESRCPSPSVQPLTCERRPGRVVILHRCVTNCVTIDAYVHGLPRTPRDHLAR